VSESTALPPARAVISTAHVPGRDRFDFWRDTLGQMSMPFVARRRPPSTFTGTLQASSFGATRTIYTENATVDVERTPALIRRSDPETYFMIVNFLGRQQLCQDRQVAVIGPGDMVLLHSSQALESFADPRVDRQQACVVAIEWDALPIPGRQLRRLVGVHLPGDDGLGALTSRYLYTLSSSDDIDASDAIRLSSVTADLLAVMLARRLRAGAALSPQTRDAVLFARVRSFILARLGDAALTPEAIAAAHHISLRTLHRVFQANGVSVASWIRQLRLERCRADLADPALRAVPVQSTAARWGFTDPSSFSRAFKAAYGLGPAAYRAHRTSDSNGTA
jgi:AraC-like DNA-binding protein